LSWKRVGVSIIKWLLVIVPLAFLVSILVRNYGQLASDLADANPGYLVLSELAFLAMTFLWGVVWHLETSAIGVGLPWKKALIAYFASQLGKYLPGKVWMMAARFAIYQSELKDAPRVSLAVLFEAALHLGGQLILLVVVAMLWGWGKYESLRIASSLILLAIVVGSHPRILEFALNVVMRVLKKPSVELELKYIQVLLLYLAYAVVYSIGLVGIFLLYAAFEPLEPQVVLPLAFSVIAAGVGGMLVIFVPAGLGVREGLMYGILAPFVPHHLAALMSVASRFMFVLAQGILILVGLFGLKRIGIKINFRAKPEGESAGSDDAA